MWTVWLGALLLPNPLRQTLKKKKERKKGSCLRLLCFTCEEGFCVSNIWQWCTVDIKALKNERKTERREWGQLFNLSIVTTTYFKSRERETLKAEGNGNDVSCWCWSKSISIFSDRSRNLSVGKICRDYPLTLGLLEPTITTLQSAVWVFTPFGLTHPDPNKTSPNDEMWKQWAVSAIDVNKRILTWIWKNHDFCKVRSLIALRKKSNGLFIYQLLHVMLIYLSYRETNRRAPFLSIYRWSIYTHPTEPACPRAPNFYRLAQRQITWHGYHYKTTQATLKLALLPTL